MGAVKSTLESHAEETNFLSSLQLRSRKVLQIRESDKVTKNEANSELLTLARARRFS